MLYSAPPSPCTPPPWHPPPNTHTPTLPRAGRRLHGLDPQLAPEARRAARADLLSQLDGAVACMERGLGPGHMLVAGARRYRAQLAASGGR